VAIIRSFRSEDREAWLEGCDDDFVAGLEYREGAEVELGKILLDQRRADRSNSAPSTFAVCAEDGGTLAGLVQFTNVRGSTATVQYGLFKPFRKRCLLERALPEAARRLGCDRIELFIKPGNRGSIEFARRIGAAELPNDRPNHEGYLLFRYEVSAETS
jgi:RimJ/RimL family protein N-acetyltransferase